MKLPAQAKQDLERRLPQIAEIDSGTVTADHNDETGLTAFTMLYYDADGTGIGNMNFSVGDDDPKTALIGGMDLDPAYHDRGLFARICVQTAYWFRDELGMDRLIALAASEELDPKLRSVGFVPMDYNGQRWLGVDLADPENGLLKYVDWRNGDLPGRRPTPFPPGTTVQ